jgi:glycosyltransferase involved in cell wall biosynthesis
MAEPRLRVVGAQHADRNIIVFLRDGDRGRMLWAQLLCRSWRAWCEQGGRISPPLPSLGAPLDIAWSRPYLSVVVPAHNASATLARALGALAMSDLARELWELVVVDDGSSDDTAAIAAEYADKLVRLPDGPHGPGYARNRGFEMTLGPCVAFVNADVMVRPHTLRRFYEALKHDRKVGAVFGSYDAQAAARNFVSQYVNLVQHYRHQRNAGEAATFWSACGAVRACAFEQAGCFDEWHFRRRQLEDLELGQRIRALGHRVLLRPEIQVTNLGRRTLAGVFGTQIFDRAIPWMRLVNRAVTRTRPTGRSLRAIGRLNIALTWLGMVLLATGLQTRLHTLLVAVAICFGVVVINDAGQLALFRQQRGIAFAMKAALFGMLYYLVSGVAMFLGWIAQHTLGEPRPDPVTQAFAELHVKRWPPVPSKRPSTPPRGIPVLSSLAELVYSRSKRARPAPEINLEDLPQVIEIPPGASLQ